ncbi:MAG TPA: condensation domain-containing protein, partial [Rubrobacter sp.]|nr:condensation domain-containing protein [Rubrobacter sp.]
LTAYARSEELRAELGVWLSEAGATPLPVDWTVQEKGGANTASALRTVSVSLDEATTRALLQEVPATYRTEINDVLLSALGRALGQWTGQGAILVDLEGHGREEIFADAHLSRTVGWFTSMYPVLLDRGEGGPGSALKRTKEALRRIPHRGLGYGLLRYLSGDAGIEERLRALPAAEVGFNYLGQLDQALSESSPFRPGRESAGLSVSPLTPRAHLLDVNASVSGGSLRMGWSYSGRVHRRETIERLAESYLDALREIVEHCQSPDAGGYTPSDFPLAQLDQERLDQLADQHRGIEDLYPLTPLQEGMLFHALYAPEGGAYITQLASELVGDLDPEAFRQAWQTVMDRHAVLRTSYAWDQLERPLQVVHRSVAVPLEVQDWSSLSEAEQQRRFEDYLTEDRRRGFDMARAPLTRLALLRTGALVHSCVWTSHHSLFDGWCLALLFKEVLSYYEAFREGRRLSLPRPRPYRDYIEWLERQDQARAEQFWRRTLAGFSEPTRVSFGALAREAFGDEILPLSAELSLDLQSVARRLRL